MTRYALLLLASFASLTGVSSRAEAQAFSGNVEVFVDGKERRNEPIAYVTQAQCSASTFRFRISGYTASIANLEMWVTASDTDCSSAASRTYNTTTTRSCWLVAELTGVSERATFEVPASEIFRASGSNSMDGRSDAASCPDSRGNRYTAYFVPLNAPTTSNPSTPPAPLTGVGPQNPKATFSLFTALPAAPGGVTGKNGAGSVTLEWDKSSGAMPQTKYFAYFDTSVGATADCAGSRLVAGETVRNEMRNLDELEGVHRVDADMSLKASLGSLEQRGVALGDYVAGAVVTRDISGNDSVLSTVACMQRVEVEGFLPACEEDPKCRDGFNSCSTSAPGWRTGGLLGLSLLFGLGVALSVRRRRHV